MRRARRSVPRCPLRAGRGAGGHSRHHRAAEQPGQRQRRLAGRHLLVQTLLAEHLRGLLTQAAGHPPFGFTQFIVKHTTVGPLEDPVGKLKDVRVDLPVGLSVNPQATPQCDLATFTSNPLLCPPTRSWDEHRHDRVGGIVAPPITFQVYNLIPSQGEPALSASAPSARTSTSKATSDGAATTTRGSRSPSRRRRSGRRSSRTASSSRGSPATGPS